MQQFEGDWPTLAERPAPPTNSLWTARAYDDRLAAPRPCRHCGRAVRQALFTGGIERQLYVEGPLLAAGVGQPHWPAFWWSHRNGLHDRYPEMDGKHEAAGDLLFVMHPCELPQYRPNSQPPAPQALPTQPAPPTPRGALLPMTNPNDDPFAGGDKLPAVSFKNAPVGTTVVLEVTAAPKLVHSRDYKTKEPAYWPVNRPGETPNPIMAAVVEGTVNGVGQSLWATKPSNLFAAIAEAQRVAGATVQPGGTLSVQFYGEEPAGDGTKKLYRAHYVPPVVDAFGGAPAAAPPAAPTPAPAAPFPPAAAPAAAPFPPAAPAPAAQPAAAAAPAAPWS